jgi:hypothetical protein
MLQHLNQFTDLQKIEKKLFVKGVIAVLLFQLIIRFLPLKRYIRLFKNSPNFEHSDNVAYDQIKLVRKTLKRIEKFFWFDISCLIKSLTLKFLFTSICINSRIELEVNKNGSSLIAHAYVIANDKIIIFKKKGFAKLSIV